MDDGIDLVLREEPVHGSLVTEIHPDERKTLAGNLADTFIVGKVAVGEIVRDDDIITGSRKLHGHVASDKSGTAGNEYSMFHNPSVFF